MTYDHKEVFRSEVLNALDRCARMTFPRASTSDGATDDELPELFRWIDAHYEKLKTRLGETY